MNGRDSAGGLGPTVWAGVYARESAAAKICGPGTQAAGGLVWWGGGAGDRSGEGANNHSMKAFWSLILGIVLLTVAVLVLSPGERGGAGELGGAAAVAPLNPAGRSDHTRPSGQQQTRGADAAGRAASGRADASEPAAGVPHRAASSAVRSAAGLSEEPAAAFIRVSDAAAVSAWLDELLHLEAEAAHAGPIRVPDALAAAKAAAGVGEQAEATEAAAPSDDPNLLAGRYPLRGSGTQDDPYQLPWEALVAVRETYRPRTGHNELPAWLDRIDGRHIALTGYLMLPLVQETTDELLLMRNQWDGCCIGVPPTPYDGIEVKLSKAISGQSSWRMNYGTITGKLIVDPYIVSGWLMGLYLLEDAQLIDSGW